MTNKPVADRPVVTVVFADVVFLAGGGLSLLDRLERFGERPIAQSLAEPDRGSDCVGGLVITGAGL